MKFRSVVFILTLLVIGIIITGVAIGQDGEGLGPNEPEAVTVATMFTYQGQLKDSGSVVNGTCDFRFELYNAVTGGSKIGSTVTKLNTDVADGRFTVTLDFGGSAFTGGNRWLLIKVRCPAAPSGGFTTLTPRQRLTAVPYAEYANHTPWSGVKSKPAGFADGVDDVPEASFIGEWQVIELTSTAVTVRTVSVTVPSAGTIIVNASGYFVFASSGSDIGRCSITNGTAIETDSLNVAGDGGASTTAYSPLGATRGFSVSAGTHTYRLVCDETLGTARMIASHLNAIFIPNSGAQSLSVNESQVTPIDTESIPSECSELTGCQP